MLKAMKKINVGFASTKHASLADNRADEDECGEWFYLVVDVAGIRPREEAYYGKESKRTDLDRVKEGTVVKVDRRRRCGWTKWLNIDSAESSWLFDVSPKDKKVRMLEVEVLSGDWTYQVCHDRVPLLPKPSMHLASVKSPRKGDGLENKDIFMVKEKVRPLNGKGTFLRLADGRGWVLDFAHGRQVVQRWESPREDTTSSSIEHAANVTSLRPQALGEPQKGNWDYIVLDPHGICLRRSPTYDKNSKLQKRLAEGELIEIVERCRGDGTTFLRLDNQGWVFDKQPGCNDRRQRLLEVEKEYGTWHYRVCTPKGIALRSRCTFSLDAKIGQGPNEGELVAICCRVKVGNTTFLQPRGADGWLFDNKNGKTLLEGPIVVELPLDTVAKIRAEGTYIHSAPTQLPWAVTKKLLLPGATAQVTQMCTLSSIRWIRLKMQSGNMDGWVTSDMVDIQQEAKEIPRCSFDAQQVRAALEAPNPRADAWG